MFVGAVFFPLLGASISGFLGRWIGDRAAQWSTVLCMALAALCGILAFGRGSYARAEASLEVSALALGAGER